ncbi:sensor histidine kinase [Paenibacillus alkalitolerans]|uniref:sensor histidine kinase n=1 Tax=Paenibacillus alkalitolerans TaxID=2799335 RepID=UPI0018F682C3|nr:sensor histidine kinase [Paenibacillus alkalitolerans]
MKLFIRDHIPLIGIYSIQLFLVTLIYWLDGYSNAAIMMYAVLLSGSVLIGYLAFRYINNKTFYSRLEHPLFSMEEVAVDSPQSPIAESLQKLLLSHYRHYQTELLNYKHKIGAHIQFVNQWVHQMKTPISVIHLMIQDEDDPRFSAIGDEVDRLKKGLETVLYTARLESFEHDMYVETLDLEAVVRSVASAQKRLFIRKRVFPSIRFDTTITVASDEKWLSFLLTQLITNAVRYTARDNGKIYLRGYNTSTNSVLEIRDEGVGISKSDLPRVFEPYFTGENGRHFQESTGMGLYLVKQICDKLGHQVELESEAGRGTVVRILFELTKV